jgi:hypothetical protein
VNVGAVGGLHVCVFGALAQSGHRHAEHAVG